VDEAALRREIGDAAREHLERHVRPGHETARRFAPYFKAVLARAASEPVAAPVPALRLRPPFSAG
jgi:hypothetical protein